MTQITPVRDLFAQTLETYKQKRRAFLTLVFLSIGVPLILLITGGGAGLLATIVAASNTALTAFLFIPIVLLFGAVLIYLQTWFQVGMIQTAAGKTTQNIRQLLSQNRNKVIPMLVLSLLSGLIVMGGFVLLVIPGIILGVWFVFAFYILVFENVRGMNALIKSREYVRGSFVLIFVYLFLLQVVLFLTQFIPTLLLKEMLNQETLASVVSFILQLLFIPVPVIFTYHLYESIRKTKSSVANEFPRARKNKYLIFALIGPIAIGLLVTVAIWASTQFSQKVIPAIDDTMGVSYNSLTSNL